jgi:hypothetical protein
MSDYDLRVIFAAHELTRFPRLRHEPGSGGVRT